MAITYIVKYTDRNTASDFPSWRQRSHAVHYRVIQLAILLLMVASVLLTFQSAPASADDSEQHGSVLQINRYGGCALNPTGDLVCWGHYAAIEASEGPYTHIDSGGSWDRPYICALTSQGTIPCWDREGEEYALFSGSNHVWFSLGGDRQCAVVSGGSVTCGKRGYGYNLQPAPLAKYTRVSVSDHACGLTAAGGVRCWVRESGRTSSDPNEYGQLDAPREGTYRQVVVYGDSACALSMEGKIVCWGRSTGAVPTGGEFAVLDEGFTCAVTEAGGIVCWGPDGSERFADAGYTYVSRVGNTLCAITTDGALECFGNASYTPPDVLMQPGGVRLPGTAESRQVPAGETPSFRSTPRLITSARLSGPTGGSVSSAASENRVTLTATPDRGYSFLRWDGDATGSQNPFTLTLSDHVFVTAIFEPIESPQESFPSERAKLFPSRVLSAQIWPLGQSVNLMLPAATGGSGFYSYSIKYEWNNDQTWSPPGVSFASGTRRLSGSPRLTLDPNPELRRFTVYLRVEDQVRRGEWDELEFVVTLSAGQALVSQPPAAPVVPASPTIRPRPTEANAIMARLAGRVRPDGRVEFALAPEGAARIAPQVRSIPVHGAVNRWLTSSNVILNGKALGRISVRRVANGRIEFSFLPDGGGNRILPAGRIFRPVVSNHAWRLSSSVEIPVPAGCRASGPVENGIAFPMRRVVLEANSSTVYSVTGIGSTGGPVTYLVCTDNQSITDRARDRALFTAAYFYSTAPNFDDVSPLVARGVSDANIGLRDYQNGFKRRAWAEIFTLTTKATYAAIALAYYSPDSASELAHLLAKHVDETIRNAPLNISLSLLEELVEEPYEVVGKIAHEHVLKAVERESWLHLTAQRRNNDEVLVFDNAKLFMDWEYEMVRGSVAGAILSWMEDNGAVSAWKDALKAAIPTSLDDVAWTLWDVGGAINERGIRSFFGFYERYLPYERLNIGLRLADNVVTVRHAWLLARLGVTEAAITQ